MRAWYHLHVPSHWRPHSWSGSDLHHPMWRWPHHWHHWRTCHRGCWHHPRPWRPTWKLSKIWWWWYNTSCWGRCGEGSRRDLSLLEGSGCFINKALCLLLHPFLVVILHVFLMFSATAVSLPHRRRVMGEVGITVITVKFGHGFVSPEILGFAPPVTALSPPPKSRRRK